jgi:hypothetical protein
VGEDLAGHAEEADAVPLIPLDDLLQVLQVLQKDIGDSSQIIFTFSGRFCAQGFSGW